MFQHLYKYRLIFTAFILLLTSCAQADGKTEDNAAGPAAPQGKLYLRTYMSGGSLYISWIYLGADGTIIQDPKHGVNPVNVAAETADNAANTGTYKVGPKSLLISWKNGKKAELSYEKDKGEFSAIDGGLVTVQKPLPAGYKLNGKFAARAATANLSASTTLVFTPDGKFTEGNVGTMSNAETSAIAKNNAAGTYSVTGNTLKLNYGGGKTAVSVITVMMIGGRKYLIIDGSYYPQQ